MTTTHDEGSCTRSESFLRLPGLFRRWELEQVIEGSDEFHISSSGTADDGSELFAVYYRERPLVPPIEGGSR
jgi:hypothetical protein